jgi:hypothetical protein
VNMSGSSPTPAIPASAIVDLARTRDGLLHWVRLRSLWETLHAGDAQEDGDALAELGRLLDGARPEAEAHAMSLAAFYDAHAAAVNALVSDALGYLEDDRMKDRLRAAGPDYAASAAARARSLVELSRSGPGVRQGSNGEPQADSPRSVFCAYLTSHQEEADVMCISSGDRGDCAYANLLASLSDQYCP